MFENIKALLSGTDLIKKAYDDTFAMMDVVAKLYDEATRLLVEGRPPTIDIHAEDKRINDMEMDIRRDILQHMSVQPDRETTAALILSAVVGYVERIGDYAKNIEELARYYRRPLRDTRAAAPLVETTGTIGANMVRTRKAFAEEDEELAVEIILSHREIRRICDSFVEEMFAREDVAKDDALVCVIYARYLKRISAGLKNVCTSVVVPFDRIGYTKILDLNDRKKDG